MPDDQWQPDHVASATPIPILAANGLVPGALKITGPDADLAKLKTYMTAVISRAAKLKIETLVFGSGAARQVPDGFDRAKAKEQILAFVKMAAPIAEQHKVLLVVEHLNYKECNIVNTVAEAMEYVKAVNSPAVQCLVDSYHFWLNNEPLSELKKAMGSIRHVHLADLDGRTPPGESGKADYRPFFAVLKEAKYTGPICVEALDFGDISIVGPRVLEFIRKQWNEA